jgi:hypothetical protein
METLSRTAVSREPSTAYVANKTTHSGIRQAKTTNSGIETYTVDAHLPPLALIVM